MKTNKNILINKTCAFAVPKIYATASCSGNKCLPTSSCILHKSGEYFVPPTGSDTEGVQCNDGKMSSCSTQARSNSSD